MSALEKIEQLAQLSGGVIDFVLRDLGLDRGELAVLTSLGAGEMTPSALADLSTVTRAGMTKRLDRLEAQSLVERSAASADRRQILVRATEAGRSIAATGSTLRTDTERKILSPLSATEQEHLEVLLTRLLARFTEGNPVQAAGSEQGSAR
ncbi:MarR family winged helix-turn-helix transcriptional regulator [Lysobacter korlensis]|uniref:MarR family winged helix-turn-helix transcriptional regulator n=1 Tax=Lysobacter korlensis TaxID=553636 RepID=A0ABV6RU43_9GAMM